MPAKAPTSEALAASTRLATFLNQPFPPRHIDAFGHDERLRLLRALIAELGGVAHEGGLDARLRLHGITSTSTSGIVQACRNWISNVTLKAMAAQHGALT
jgi:hypothetical protein